MNFRTDMRKSKENANNQYSMLKSEYVETLNRILEILKTSAHKLDVQEITNGWYTIGHPDFDHLIQLEVVAQGANLDITLLDSNQDINVYPLGREIASAKLTKGNENFAVEKILAVFNLHSRSSKLEPSDDDYTLVNHYIKLNNRIYNEVLNELSFRRNFPTSY